MDLGRKIALASAGAALFAGGVIWTVTTRESRADDWPTAASAIAAAEPAFLRVPRDQRVTASPVETPLASVPTPAPGPVGLARTPAPADDPCVTDDPDEIAADDAPAHCDPYEVVDGWRQRKDRDEWVDIYRSIKAVDPLDLVDATKAERQRLAEIEVEFQRRTQAAETLDARRRVNQWHSEQVLSVLGPERVAIIGQYWSDRTGAWTDTMQLEVAP